MISFLAMANIVEKPLHFFNFDHLFIEKPFVCTVKIQYHGNVFMEKNNLF